MATTCHIPITPLPDTRDCTPMASVSARLSKERIISASDVASLLWEGDALVDWVGGIRRFGLDGSIEPRSCNFAYKFDTATASPTGEFVALITRTGTKALLLRRGEIVRQLNRDFYHAHVYPYPLTFVTKPDGREAVIHCPECYCQLEIEDAASGARIGSAGIRKPKDFFASGLDASPEGRWLLSAGWVWHPFHAVNFYDLRAAMHDASVLDHASTSPPGSWEFSSAAFVDDTTAMVGTLDECFGDEDDPVDDKPGKHCVALWPIGSGSFLRSTKLSHPPGTLMPVGSDHVVTFYEHPRLYDLRNGVLVDEWQVDSGKQTGSITWDELPPPIALQPGKSRFAVATPKAVHVVEIDRRALLGDSFCSQP